MITKEDLLKVSKNISVLYAEDEQIIREQYVSIFSLLFKEVETAENGMDALEKYSTKQYDLVITDLTMPKMDGISLIGKLLEINPDQHIIVMTAHNSNENLRASIDFQIDGVLLKPVVKEKLFSLLHKVCHTIVIEKKEKSETFTIEQSQDLFIVVVDKMKELVDAFGIEIERFILERVKEHLQNFGIEETLFIHNDAILFTTKHAYLKNILETLQDFSQRYNTIEVLFNGLKIYITLSYGAILKKKAQKSKEDYLSYADKVIDEIRKNEQSTDIVTIDIDLQEAKQEEALQWLRKAYEALEQNMLVPFYQPIVDIKSKETISYEIFSRIKEDDKYILPKFFIDLSEKAGILEAISRVIFEKSFEKFSTTTYSFCINIGNLELREQAFIEYFVYLASRFEIAHERVILNILHHKSINPNGRRVQRIVKLKELGFKVALKWSIDIKINMELITKVKPDYIKINQRIVQKSLVNKYEEEMLASLLQYAAKLNIQTVLYNVDDANVLNKAKSLGFNAIQGYLIAHPCETLEQPELKAL